MSTKEELLKRRQKYAQKMKDPIYRANELKKAKERRVKCYSKEDLIVHHIIPFRKTKNNSLKNLITLCRSCHAIIENKIKRYGVKIGNQKFWNIDKD